MHTAVHALFYQPYQNHQSCSDTEGLIFTLPFNKCLQW